MGFLPGERGEAVALYRRIGCETFPYDTRSVPFIGWNNPALYGPGYDELLGKVHTFGVRLNEHTAVIDIDADRGGSLTALEDAFGLLPATLTVQSPSGPRNLHLMFTTTVPLRTCKELTKQFPGIDFLSDGSHVKGATSVRYLNTGEELMYKLQRPVFDPAPLPASLEHEWSTAQPGDVDQLFDALIAEGDEPRRRVKLTAKEASNIRGRIREALKRIRTAEAGQRHDVLFRNSRDIYRAAVLRGQSMHAYDRQIAEAYKQSGGDDLGDLARTLKSVKLWAVRHPMPPPGVTAYHAMRTREIGMWADLATADTRAQDKCLRALILALANEATTSMNMTTAGELIAKRYAGVGDRFDVVANLHWLAARGWLLRNGEAITEKSLTVPHYKLGRR